MAGTLRGIITPTALPPNYFDPANGRVPDGYSNKTQGPTVTVADPAIEFGYADSTNTVTADITNTQVILNDFTSVGSSGYTVTLTDAGFDSLVKMSDTFQNGGIRASRSGNLLTFSVPAFTVNGLTSLGGYSAVFTVNSFAPVPEPGSIALLVGIGVTGAAFLNRKRRK